MLSPPYVSNRIKALGEQLRLNLRQAPSYAREAFVASVSNAEALARVDAWPRWPAPALALVGPPGSGKTHLARVWAHACGAAIVAPGDTAPVEGPVLVEDVDRASLDEGLFHLLNRASDAAHTVLITGRTRPGEWPTALPDLRSRLNALAVVELGQPDDGLLEGVLRRLFAERAFTPSPELIAYLRARIERSVPAAAAAVERLEAEAARQGRPINRALARSVFAESGGAAFGDE